MLLACATALPCGDGCAEELALLELVIDGRATHQVQSFVLREGQPHATRAAWRGFGVRDDPAADDAEVVGPAQLRGVRARLDLERRTLALELPPDPAALTLFDRGAPQLAPTLDHSSGALLNYDLSHERGGRSRARTAGLLEGRWFGSSGVLEHSTLLSDLPGARQRRLETAFTRANTQSLERLRVGDIVVAGLVWTRPLRLGGVQLVTDFALRPDLVTAPTPQLTGTAAVPSTVDVLVNGVRQLSEPVTPGRFEIRQLPVVNGLGDVSVVVRDALGRESVQSLSFYASNRQLAHGLSAYAFEFGQIRRGFGSDDDRYGDLAVMATWRHGVSDLTTLESHAETARGTTVAGAGALTNLGLLGLVGGAVALSQSQGRQGVLVSASAERRTPTLSLQLALSVASDGYRDVATTQGDAPLQRNLQAGAGWQLGAQGSVGVALIDQRTGSTPASASQRARLASTTYSRALRFGAQAYASAYRASGAASKSGVSIGLSLPFGGRGAASSTLTHDGGGNRLSVAAGESAGTTGEFGWRVQSARASAESIPSQQILQASYLAPAARLTAETECNDAACAVRLSAQGGVLALGGRLFATQRVDDSVALVDVDGQRGVSVFHQNRLVGRTDANGQIIVPGLLSFQTNRLAIATTDLPLDVDPGELTREVRPADRSGLHVRFSLARERSALVLLRDARGAPLPVGARVVSADAAAGPATVGHDGQAYLRGLGDQNRVAVDWGEGRCVARFAWTEKQAETGRIGPVRCE